jgi:hypothetical protein
MQPISSSALALLGLSLFALEVSANSGFASSCNSIGVGPPGGNTHSYWLVGNCKKAGGGNYNVGTTLDLDVCFGNSGGRLVPQLQ